MEFACYKTVPQLITTLLVIKDISIYLKE